VSALIANSSPDLVFHLAGITQGSATNIYRTNTLGGINLLEAVRLHCPNARILIVGSAAEYGYVSHEKMPIREDYPCHPNGAYGLSKYAVTLAAQDATRVDGLKTVVVRPFNIVGAGMPDSLVIGAVIKRAKQALASAGQPVVTVGNLDTERDFIAVDDVISAYITLLRGEAWGEVFNICTGQPHRIRDIVEEVLGYASQTITLQVDPALLRPTDIRSVYGSHEKATTIFGFCPRTELHQALYAAWHAVMGAC